MSCAETVYEDVAQVARSVWTRLTHLQHLQCTCRVLFNDICTHNPFLACCAQINMLWQMFLDLQNATDVTFTRENEQSVTFGPTPKKPWNLNPHRSGFIGRWDLALIRHFVARVNSSSDITPMQCACVVNTLLTWFSMCLECHRGSLVFCIASSKIRWS